MESSAHTTVSRDEFLQNLKPATVPTSDHDDKACHSCMEEMRFSPLESDAGDTISDQAEDIPSRAVILHDRHLLCEGCAREWLAMANTCPECRKVLFEVKQEELSNEPTFYLDSVNLHEWSNSEELKRLLQELGPPFLDQNSRALAYFTRFLISTLRERTVAYEEQTLLLDFEYSEYDDFIGPETAIVEEEAYEACVIGQRAVVDFWAWWAKRFFPPLVNADFDLRHHPLATSLLFQMLHDLKILPESVPINRTVLAHFLSYNLTRFAETCVGSTQALDFDGYIRDMVDAALSATAGRMHVPASYPHEERKSTYEALYA